MAMKELNHFQEVASELYNGELRAWQEVGNRVVGTVCSSIPEEVIHAGGLLPLRVRAPGLLDTAKADAHLHRINCSYTRSVLELLMRGELSFLDGLITTNTCDHMLRLAGELEAKAEFPVHYFSMYHTLGSSSREWLLLEMEKLIRYIEQSFSVEISEEDLRRSVSVYNRTRRLMTGLGELRKKAPPAVSGAEYLAIAVAGMSLPREEFNRKLEAVLPALRERSSGSSGQPRVMLVGGACDMPEFIEFIEAKGIDVVADGLCFGARRYQGEVDEGAEAMLPAIADHYLDRIACPAIIDGFDHSYGILRKMIGDWAVDAVICARLKFCDHWGGQRKMLAEELRKEGVPVLDLEREYSTAGSGQIATRVQAFLEML
jgi:benzoyl-CoA reductase/2-hydroxyglutaryl-CoA dehydratase subunit BcrC/BadD/HgdB